MIKQIVKPKKKVRRSLQFYLTLIMCTITTVLTIRAIIYLSHIR